VLGSRPPCNTMFCGPPRVFTPNSILSHLAVFAQGSRVKRRDRQMNRQTLCTLMTIGCSSCIRCSLKMQQNVLKIFTVQYRFYTRDIYIQSDDNMTQQTNSRTEINKQATKTFPLILRQCHYARQIVLVMQTVFLLQRQWHNTINDLVTSKVYNSDKILTHLLRYPFMRFTDLALISTLLSCSKVSNINVMSKTLLALTAK